MGAKKPTTIKTFSAWAVASPTKGVLSLDKHREGTCGAKFHAMLANHNQSCGVRDWKVVRCVVSYAVPKKKEKPHAE